jgi:septal ring factor EnvC (AmiA/AmiB activator)
MKKIQYFATILASCLFMACSQTPEQKAAEELIQKETNQALDELKKLEEQVPDVKATEEKIDQQINQASDEIKKIEGQINQELSK